MILGSYPDTVVFNLDEPLVSKRFGGYVDPNGLVATVLEGVHGEVF